MSKSIAGVNEATKLILMDININLYVKLYILKLISYPVQLPYCIMNYKILVLNFDTLINMF